MDKTKHEPRFVTKRLKNKHGGNIQFFRYDLEGSIDAVFATLEELKREFADKNLELCWEYDRDDCYALVVYERRKETQEEVEERVSTEERARRNQEKLERQQYKELAKKFGKHTGE